MFHMLQIVPNTYICFFVELVVSSASTQYLPFYSSPLPLLPIWQNSSEKSLLLRQCPNRHSMTRPKWPLEFAFPKFSAPFSCSACGERQYSPFSSPLQASLHRPEFEIFSLCDVFKSVGVFWLKTKITTKKTELNLGLREESEKENKTIS